MKYEFRAPTLHAAVSRSLRGTEMKASATIDAGISGSWNEQSISVRVVEGRRYTISWSAGRPATDGVSYGIRIISHDGHGSHTDGFSRSGRWSFVARTTGEIEFSISVSFGGGSIFRSFPVEIDIG